MHRLGLRGRLFAIILGTTSLLGLAVIFSVRGTLIKTLEEELREKGIYMATHLANESADLILTEQFLKLNVLVHDFLNNDRNSSRYAYIENQAGEIIAHSFAQGFPTELKGINQLATGQPFAAQPLTTGKGVLLDIAVPIMHGQLGTAHLGVSEDDIRYHVAVIVGMIMAVVVLVLALGGSAAIVFARRITSPLANLVEAAGLIGAGDLKHKVHISTSDELGQLGKAINKMVDTLGETMVSRERFQQQSKFLTHVFESIPNPFYVVNINDYSIRMANSATAAQEAWRHATCHALTHKSEKPCCGEGESGCTCPLNEVRRSGKPAILEHCHYDQAGNEKYYEVHGYPIFDDKGNIVQMIEYAMDITGRKRAEKELRQNQEELRALNTTIEAERAKLSESLAQISSLLEQVVKQKNLEVRYTNPSLAKCYEIKDCAKTGCPCYGTEQGVRCWQVAGTYCGGKVQGSFAQKSASCLECQVFKEATRDPTYLVGEHFNNMMHILQMKSRELEVAYAELKATHSQLLQQEKMASIGQLAAGVAHEINNPMGFISSNLSSLERYTGKLTEFLRSLTQCLDSHGAEMECARQLKEKSKKLKVDFIIEDIHDLIAESLEGASRVKKIVMDLKNFSRVDQAEHVPADINECLESTLNIVWNELKYKAKVMKQYGAIPQTKCYPMQLNQVFMNILINAAHAIEKQGEISIRTWSENDVIQIAISDTGCGIPEKIINRIFEPFFTTKEVGKGTGLGMSIAYDIIKKHNGEIKVDSTVGKGTTFTISLPVVEG